MNNKDLTADKFINNPFDKKSKLYKTGDLVKWNKNGSLDFIGRIDGQVKIRGFRVELNEINNTILKFPNIKNSATIIQEINGSKEICSYIVPNDSHDIESLKFYLKKYLPNYMIPSYFIIMDSLPITINGKIDKQNLPIPNIISENLNVVEPKTTFEIEIFQIVSKLLNIKTFSIDDNFFYTLGMDSLNAMTLCSSLYKYDVSVQDISDFPTIRLLAEKIEKNIKTSHFENLLPKIDVKNQKFKFNLNTVLLTGPLGFLGMHLLKELLLSDKVKKIYCLVRNKGNSKYTTRFSKTLEYYFNDSLNQYVQSKICLLQGDFTDSTLGLSEDEYKEICANVKTVIHCGAKVKHYGSFQTFSESNILATQNIIEFCKKSGAKLAHISTISVGGFENPDENKKLSEEDFNIGQVFNNHVYMITKYIAEYHILSAIMQQQIHAKIFRLGNIMPRLSDNVFQQNLSDNAIFGKLSTIIKLGKITKSYEELLVDFSPVDLCASAIMNILQNTKSQTIYHIYNDNLITVKQFLKIGNIKTNYINKEDFIEMIRNQKSPLSYHLLNDLKYKNTLTPVDNKLTIKILNENNFCWNKLNKNYIKKIIDSYLIQ